MPSKNMKVLDHGYVRFIESWGHGEEHGMSDGSDGPVYKEIEEREAGIIEAARQSTQASFRGWEEDQKLLKFLYNSKPPHSGPFEFAGLIIEVQAPIFVFREWHRHRTQSYNEMSARYAPLPDLNYIPTVERLLPKETKNKQAGTIADATPMTPEMAEMMREELAIAYANDETFYQRWLHLGAPKEVARIKLPVGRYSRMRASANLRNWLAFMTLRNDPGAQWEIQQYASVVADIIFLQFPRVHGLYFQAKQDAFMLQEKARKWDVLMSAYKADNPDHIAILEELSKA